MAQLLIRNVKDETVAKLKERAKQHGRSLSAEVREVLEKNVAFDQDAWLAEARSIRESLRGTKQTDSADLIREDRDR
jgi:plasmid stability protein